MELMLSISLAMLAACAGALLSCLPGFHVTNVLAVIAGFVFLFPSPDQGISSSIMLPVAGGLVAGYAVAGIIPAILLAAPDDSAFFTLLPGQRMLMEGKGLDALTITAIGECLGFGILLLGAVTIIPAVAPLLREVLKPHFHWIIWCVLAFMLMSEWPMTRTFFARPADRFLRAWKPLVAGIIVFIGSGLLGFILQYRSPLAPENAFQSLFPAFAGLFTLPWLIMNIASRVKAPDQQPVSVRPDMESVVRGTIAGCAGGMFSVFVPTLTGGVGSFLAGHASSIRNDHAFLVSQGASRVVYIAGGLVLLAVPGMEGTAKGGPSAIVRSITESPLPGDYALLLASIAIGGSVSLLLLFTLARAVLRIVTRLGYRCVAAISLIITVLLVLAATGPQGVFVMLVACGIGLVPLCWGTRRLNCLGIILLPAACNMSGFGPQVARALGLL